MKEVAYITHSETPLSQAILLRLSNEGMDFVVDSSLPDSLKETLQKKGSKILAVSGNLEKEEDVKAIFAKIEQEYGRIDVLVNNSFRAAKKSFEETSYEEFQADFRHCVIETMLVSQEASALMTKKKIHGHIANASSDHAFVVDPKEFDSSVDAWALRGTTRAMAKQLAKADIKVNAFCIGEADPEGVAELVAFLVGDVNVNMTGQNVMVNGGRYMD